MKLRHARNGALSTVGLLTVASAFAFSPLSVARGEGYTTITEAEAAKLYAASGGNEIRKVVNDDGSVDIIHIYKTVSANKAFTIPEVNDIKPDSLQFLLIGGGGAGSNNCGGGGGAGGVVFKEDMPVVAGSWTNKVGAGGSRSTSATAAGGAGTASTFIYNGVTYTANGGGRGGYYNNSNRNGTAGGSGGGGSAYGSNVGSGGTGNQPTSASGGFGNNGGKGASSDSAGGGGGAGAKGVDATSSTPGAGGDGLPFSISGEEVWYAGGGGGARSNQVAGGAGGKGGGGAGAVNLNKDGTAGTANTGGGGGGSAGGGGSTSKAGAGGSGIFIVRYSLNPPAVISYDDLGVKIVAQGAELLTSEEGEAILRYTNTQMVGTLTLPNYVQAWVLAVGGGGAGANPGTAANNAGGAGGGGAGGFVENQNLGLSAGVYSIVVGAGGTSPSGQDNGMNGGYSEISGSSLPRAEGGGGGGKPGEAGLAGGSGGGGSKNKSGGAAVADEHGDKHGNDGGGCANVNRAGGGGGGAGSAGDRATTLNIGGAGGAGKASSITGDEVIYAAGGGGGSRAGTGGAGGSNGIGGVGGGSSTEPGNGVDGTGSGGGGGCYNHQLGGSGGSGVVIIRIKRVMPTKPATPGPTIPYDGEEHVVLPPSDAYTIVGTAAATDAGAYSFTATPNTGFCWGDGTSNAVTVPWEIAKSDLVVARFTMAGWQLGEAQPKPDLVVTAGAGGPEVTLTEDEVRYEYAKAGTSTWSTAAPATPGEWKIRATITGSANFNPPAERPEATFSVWAWEEGDVYCDALAYHAKFTVTGYDDARAALTNFPMLVKVSEATTEGFHYNQVRPDHSDLRFLDETGAFLPFEVDEWHTDGTSFVWVKVPVYTNGTTVTMCWGELEGAALPAVKPADVWKDYITVYHLNEDMGEAINAAGNTYLNAKPATGSTVGEGSAAWTQMVAYADAPIGRGRVNQTFNLSGNGGNSLRIPNYMASLSQDGVFTVSGWFKANEDAVLNGFTTYLFSGKKGTAATVNYGYDLVVNNSPTLSLVRGAGNGKYVQSAINDIREHWVYFSAVYDVSNITFYVDGNLGAYQSAAAQGPIDPAYVKNNQNFVGMGVGNNADGTLHSFNGQYDEIHLRDGTVSADWVWAEYHQVADGASCVSGPAIIIPDATCRNFWVEEPTLSKTAWPFGDPAPEVYAGRPAYGGPAYYIVASPDGVAWTNSLPTEVGGYEIVFYADAGTTKPEGTLSWGPLATEPIALMISAESPRTGLAGTAGSATLSGRVLLANNDPGTAAPILDQDYGQTAASSPDVFWVHDEAAAPSVFPNLKAGANHILCAGAPVAELCGGTNIWTLTDVYLGTTSGGWASWDPVSQEYMRSYVNLLPFSKSSASSASKAMCLVMRNIETAVVCSPCYTNGIGTVYFDAVNGWTTDAGTGYNLVVETLRGADALAESVPEETWAAGRVPLRPIMRDTLVSPDFVAAPETDELALAITNGAESVDSFYRVVVPIECHEPIRFRIRRTTVPPDTSFTLDAGGFILLDNIVVSYPAMRADLEPYGVFDPARGGKQTLGYENTWDVPFPSVKDVVTARGKAAYYTNPGDLEADPSKFVTAATLHYRWRYLEQKVWKAWKAVPLGTTTLTAPRALDLSDAAAAVDDEGRATLLPGDVEFWYDLVLNAPYYEFVDYAAVDGFDMKEFYSERVAAVTNRAAGVTFASQGTDWFVRLREGPSDYEALNLEVWEPDADGQFETTSNDVKVIEMELISSHVWRGYLQTLDPIPAGARFRVKALNHQTPGATEFATNEVTLALRNDVTALPVSDILTEGLAPGWATVPVDATTGYLMFQVDDDTRSVTIIHADYQNFNAWNDAKREDHLFVGNSTEDEGKAGASPRARESGEDFDDWKDMVATNALWREMFDTSAQVTLNTPPFQPFQYSATPNGWAAAQGMFVYGRYKDNSTFGSVKNYALQMEGCGKGYVEFVDAAMAPRGLESITFSASLGQFIKFEDFCYYDAESKASMSNYTFVARTAFDLAKNTRFRGNASLSLIAYYRPRIGCYEFRFEPRVANSTTNPTGVQGNNNILSLYRWRVDDRGRLAGTCLGSYTNTTYICYTDGAGGKYLPMYLSVSNDAAGVSCIMAGITRYNNNSGGMTPDDAIATAQSGKRSISVCYRDTTAARLTSGTYGVLSANCEGVFLHPTSFGRPVGFLSNFTTNNKLDKYTADNDTTKVNFTGTEKNCYDQLTESAFDPDCQWVCEIGRIQPFKESGKQYGLKYEVIPQKVLVQTATPGKSDWRTIGSTNVNSFGSASSRENFLFKIYSTKDCSLRITSEGDPDDVRTDVVLDEISLAQWRGNDYADVSEMDKLIPGWTDPTDYRRLTNFTFTTAWIRDKGLLLSAKRTATNTVAAIRSPLFDGSYGRGIGLGMISFSYEKADPRAELLVQVATNITYNDIANIDVIDGGYWTTITNFTFAGEASGSRSCYIGLHGVKGAMRLVVPTNVVADAAASGDPNYGEILVKDVYCRDEPLIDAGCWWGWNLRTLGPDTGGRDSEGRMFLPDLSDDIRKKGLSLALNNSVSADIYPHDVETYKQHLPFVQTPTFASNIVGEVTFRARKYDASSASQPAQVTLYGSVTGDTSGQWRLIKYFLVSNTTYTTYAYKTEPGEAYNAFRLAVTGVDDVIGTDMARPAPVGYDSPVRVLIDEVLVSEAVRARVAFRNVGAFRGVAPASLNATTWVPNVPSEREQPLCNESWGVQCEVYAALLPDEINFGITPRVKLYWFEGDYPWGFEAWRTNRNCRSAFLSPATDTNLVYRSSYLTSQNAVIPMSRMPGQVVQYALEVEYYQHGSLKPMTNVLSAADWRTPAWYHPVDLNRDNAARGGFSAYTILDTVAPHWAWINEVNLFGEYDYNYDNSDKNYQFVEVAVPAEADITGWQVRLLEPRRGTDSVITNVLGIFGDGNLSATKPNLLGMASNMVFRVLANKGARDKGCEKGRLRLEDGTLDAVWKVDTPTTVFTAAGEVSAIDPVAFQLVRGSGIVEHEIVTMGTNWWSDLEYYNQQYHPSNTVNYLNSRLPGSRFFYVGDDDGGLAPSRGVFASRGETSNVWNNAMVCTPGRVNEGQAIDPDHPTPNGASMIVYCNLAESPGHIRQTVGEHVNTNGNVILVIQKGLTMGTNITYRVDPWYTLGTVTTNGRPAAAAAAGEPRTFTVNVAANASNNVTVVAAARVSDSLLALGLDEDNRYTEAVMDWLSNGRTLRGAFADPEADEVKLADYISMSGHIVTNMTLTQMYWLDMDPTVGNLALKAGMATPPGPAIVPGYQGGASVTNVRMSVFMMITNRTEDTASPHYGEAWSPYALRSVEPGVTSWDYALENDLVWTSATFKVTGILANGLTSEGNRRNWIPLRWFVFHEDSFYQPGDAEGAPFTSKIEVKDPFGTESPGYSEGWYDWVRTHGYTPMFFSWSLDERLKPFGVEVLKQKNYYDEP